MATTIEVGSICHCGYVRTPSNPHEDCSELPFPAAPPKTEPRPRYPMRRERIVEVRRSDGILGEHVEVERTPNGAVVLRHTIPGRSVDSTCLTADEAAALCAFLLRTLRPSGARFEITEAGRLALAEAQS